MAQCVWWLASVVGLDLGLIEYIDSQQVRSQIVQEKIQTPDTSEVELEENEVERQDKILKECEEYL